MEEIYTALFVLSNYLPNPVLKDGFSAFLLENAKNKTKNPHQLIMDTKIFFHEIVLA
jgi:hypothetical protein